MQSVKQDHNSKVGKWSVRGQISLYFLHVQAKKPTNFLLFPTILGSQSPLDSVCSRICQGSSENSEIQLGFLIWLLPCTL